MIKISIVTTTKSNMKNVVRLAESLYPIYKKLHEFIIVDAGTPGMDDAHSYLFDFPIIVDGKGTTRGQGKNIGIDKATGDVIVFFDDDVEITNGWLMALKKSLKHYDIVAGYSPRPDGIDMPRVPVFVDGQDTTWPTCNIAYKKKVIDDVGYFDEKMITAEDIDYNVRCVEKEYTIGYNPKMKVLHYHRETSKGFARQAFWNGYGRRQLYRIHPELRNDTKIKELFRLGFGFLGYVLGDLLNGNRNS